MQSSGVFVSDLHSKTYYIVDARLFFKTCLNIITTRLIFPYSCICSIQKFARGTNNEVKSSRKRARGTKHAFYREQSAPITQAHNRNALRARQRVVHVLSFRTDRNTASRKQRCSLTLATPPIIYPRLTDWSAVAYCDSTKGVIAERYHRYTQRAITISTPLY